jgi:hypothetical protein
VSLLKNGSAVDRFRPHHEPAPPPRHEARGAHQPRDPLAPDPLPLRPQAACTRGLPYVRRLAVWIAVIVVVKATSAVARAGVGRRRHA